MSYPANDPAWDTIEARERDEDERPDFDEEQKMADWDVFVIWADEAAPNQLNDALNYIDKRIGQLVEMHNRAGDELRPLSKRKRIKRVSDRQTRSDANKPRRVKKAVVAA